MKNRFRYFFLISVFFSLALIMACVSGVRLKTVSTTGEQISGTYNLILYGGRFSGDLETVAFLDKADDAYTFEPYATEDFYVVKKGLSAKEALEKAGHFVSGHPEFRFFQLREIVDAAGKGIGYEVHPLYMPITYGTDDVFEVTYMLRDGNVVIYVRLYPWVERMLYGGGPDRGHRD